MKYFNLLICLLLTNFIFGQTTLEEYNYLTKGYKLDIDTGRDIKSGYVVDFVQGASNEISLGESKVTRAVRLYEFKKISQDSATVALLVEFVRPDTRQKTYCCIPSKESNSEVLNKAQQDFYKIAQANSDNVVGYHYLWNVLELLGNAYIDNSLKEE